MRGVTELHFIVGKVVQEQCLFAAEISVLPLAMGVL